MISWCCAVAPFTVEDRSLINELRFEDIGTERKAAILEQTFDSRRKWVVQCRPSFGDYFLKFPPLKDMGYTLVAMIVFVLITSRRTVEV